jgi:hypothetical protein
MTAALIGRSPTTVSSTSAGCKKGTVPFADVVHSMDIAAMVGVGLIVADPVE